MRLTIRSDADAKIATNRLSTNSLDGREQRLTDSTRPLRHSSRAVASIIAMRLITTLTLSIALGGCTVAQVQQEIEALYRVTVVMGRILPPPNWQGPVIVAAIAERDGKRVIAHQVSLHEPGGYELVIPDGRYRIVAFGDSDNNHVPDAVDPAAFFEPSLQVDDIDLISIDLQLTFGTSAFVRAALPTTNTMRTAHSTQVGAIADLSAPAFSADVGKQGYWQPLEFFRRFGGNIYALEPYDSKRTPVLFVHGAMGSAQDFRSFYKSLDRTRYQVWIYQYPSGAALDANADLLYWKLLQLQLQNDFTQLHIVAHSMGGLLVRRFLTNYGAQFPQIDQFVSISTPWAGEPSASLGVKNSLAVVPSWRDLQPDGNFIRDLFARPLPPNITHTLLFSHRGGYSLLRPTTDGTVTLASQLRSEAQANAHLVVGFDEDHVSVLKSSDVLDRVSQVLNASEAAPKLPAGAVRMTVSSGNAKVMEGLATLVLSPVTADANEDDTNIVVALNSARTERIVARVPPGTYDARLVSPAFRSTPKSKRLRITKGEDVRLNFRLAPRGSLSASIVLERTATTQTISYSGSVAKSRIQRVIVDGPHGQRILVPSSSDHTSLDALVAGRDELSDLRFTFLDLPRGRHTLTIVADGYAPHTSQHFIEPGIVPPVTPIVLRPIDPRATASKQAK